MVVANTRLNQVIALIRNYIAQRRLERGDRLPSEAAMARELGVSRNTLREAYITLESEGFILRRHGIGTFVAQPARIKDSLNAFASFRQIIKAAGYTPRFQTLAAADITPPPEVCETFSIPSTGVLFYLERVVFAGRQPAIYLNDYFAPTIRQTDADWNEFDGNLVQFLHTVLGLPLHQMHTRIRAVALAGEAARILRLPENTPAMHVRSIIYTVTHQPVTHSKIWFNSNIVELDAVRTVRGV